MYYKKFISLLICLFSFISLYANYNIKKNYFDIINNNSFNYIYYNKSTSINNKSNSNYLICKKSSNKTIYTGPRGGKYHYNKSGKKVYHKRK